MTVIDKIAWIRLENGAILSSRSRGKDVYYIPGGKREPGEGDLDTLVREIREELSVTIAPDTAEHVGTFHAQAHGHPDGTMVRMTCYTADYQGVLQPDSEIEEMVWLTHADRHRVSPVDRINLDHLHDTAPHALIARHTDAATRRSVSAARRTRIPGEISAERVGSGQRRSLQG